MSRDEDRADVEAINAAAGDDPWSVLTLLGADLTGARRQRGRDVMARCIDPNHDDRSASASYRSLRGGIAFLCFSCGARAADFCGFVAIREGLNARTNFPAVKRRAAELVGVSLERHRDRTGLAPRRPRVDPVVALAAHIDAAVERLDAGRPIADHDQEAIEAAPFDLVVDAMELLGEADDDRREQAGDRREQAQLEAFEAMAERFARWGWTHHDAPGVAVDWKAIDAEQAAEARAQRAARVAADLNRRAGRAAA